MSLLRTKFLFDEPVRESECGAVFVDESRSSVASFLNRVGHVKPVTWGVLEITLSRKTVDRQFGRNFVHSQIPTDGDEAFHLRRGVLPGAASPGTVVRPEQGLESRTLCFLGTLSPRLKFGQRIDSGTARSSDSASTAGPLGASTSSPLLPCWASSS